MGWLGRGERRKVDSVASNVSMTSMPAIPSLLSVTISAPAGAAWEFLALFLVVIVAPPVLERARLPGIIGLLLGGYVIGPHGLNLIGAGNTTVPELGQVGLLYLMFVAGVELDLRLVRQHRRSVVLFGTLAFTIPLLFGSLVGFSLSWSIPAALLLGSLMASHTLLTYPTVRNAGLSTHRAVATAVGATVLTDTASLIVLAFVAGSQVKGGSAVTIGVQVVFGLVVLAIFSLVILPRLVSFAFRFLGTDRVVRYLLTLASFLAAATLASSVGIEGIVGAFFAGLGMNRLVPTEGPLMERVDFFGQALFVPIFLISVGMLLQPKVMIQPETLKLAGLFILAAVGGKGVATLIVKRPLRLSGSETLLMLGLTIPQAAATLAATIVGFNIGLFDQSVVNAVLVLILVSIVLATLTVERAKAYVSVPAVGHSGIGRHVLVVLESPGQAQIGFAIAASIAGPDGGIVRGLLTCPPDARKTVESDLLQLRSVGYRVGVDTEPALLVHQSFADGIGNAVVEHEPSFVLVGQSRAPGIPTLSSPAEAVAASVSDPVALVLGEVSKISQVVLVEPPTIHDLPPSDARAIAREVAARLGGKTLTILNQDPPEALAQLAPGQVGVWAINSPTVLGAVDLPPNTGAVIVLHG
jgi:Kef-type K+ transport system membrane component KefB